MFRRVLPFQEPDEVPRRNVDAKRRLLAGRGCVDRFFAYLESDRLLCTETEVTISSLKRGDNIIDRSSYYEYSFHLNPPLKNLNLWKLLVL